MIVAREKAEAIGRVVSLLPRFDSECLEALVEVLEEHLDCRAGDSGGAAANCLVDGPRLRVVLPEAS